jgi:hypothetical protein
MKNNTWMLTALATFCVLVLAAVRVGAQSVQPTSETYSWSGELVAFDPDTRIATVKSRVVGEQALKEMPGFKPGDKIVLRWSGFDTYADAISRAVRHDASAKWSDAFTFPVEFVTYEAERQYVTFKFQVPLNSVESIRLVKPGEWVTAIARHRPSSEAEAITAVNAYTAAATAHRSTN